MEGFSLTLTLGRVDHDPVLRNITLPSSQSRVDHRIFDATISKKLVDLRKLIPKLTVIRGAVNIGNRWTEVGLKSYHDPCVAP